MVQFSLRIVFGSKSLKWQLVILQGLILKLLCCNLLVTSISGAVLTSLFGTCSFVHNLISRQL